jgi:two-component system phosphate regulon sensor histidine kinase PhoR
VKRRLSLRGRMVATAVVATAAVLVVLALLAGPLLERRARDDAFASLTAEARLMARVVEDALAEGVVGDELDATVDAAARDVAARVTIVATDGRVLADSSVSGAALATVENHGARPEVIAALAGRVAQSERVSSTVRVRLLYAAVPIQRGGRVIGVARVSRGAERIEAQGRELLASAALAGLVALLFAALVSLGLSAAFGRSLAAVMEAARQLARGNLAARAHVPPDDEIGEIAQILNRSAEELQSRLAELARDRARTEAILSAMDDGVLAVDHAGLVTLANRSLVRAMGLSAPLGRHYLETIRQPEVSSLVEDVLRTGERGEREVEILALRRSFSVTGVPFPGVEGAPHGAVLTFNDTTERLRVEEIRRDFVANASHELRTPLTSIRGFVEALEDGAKDEPGTAERFLGKIRTHADRMASLVEDLLELSRLESGARVPEPDQTALAELAAEVVATFAEQAARKPVTLRHEAHGTPTLVTDRERVRRILENLVDNAVKYTPAGGHVTVVTSALGAGGGGEVQVRDDGPGIAPEHRERVFERFYRVDKARSRELGGTGLGLSIVRHLAESIGAQVALDSAPGKGSTFSLRLPPRPDEPLPQPHAAAAR